MLSSTDRNLEVTGAKLGVRPQAPLFVTAQADLRSCVSNVTWPVRFLRITAMRGGLTRWSSCSRQRRYGSGFILSRTASQQQSRSARPSSSQRRRTSRRFSEWPFGLWELWHWKPWHRPSAKLLAGAAGVVCAVGVCAPQIKQASGWSANYWCPPTLHALAAVFGEMFPLGLIMLAVLAISGLPGAPGRATDQ
jgi:hypothetical protein